MLGPACWLLDGQVEKLCLACLEQDVSYDAEAEIHNRLEVLIGLELAEHLCLCPQAKVLLLNLSHFIQMIFELIRFDLGQVVFA